MDTKGSVISPTVIHCIFRQFFLRCLGVVFATFLFGASYVGADDISFTEVEQLGSNESYVVSWDVFGQRWHTIVNRDAQFGSSIPVIKVSVSTGNEELAEVLPNCYFRGSLVDDLSNPIANTYAYVNLCDTTIPFTGFVSDDNGVYVISRSETSPVGIQMTIDNPALPVPYIGISQDGGVADNSISPGLVPRHSHSGLFPSIEIAIEPAYIARYEGIQYQERVAENFAFANFIYQLNAMKQLNLIAITLLDQNLIWSGGSGSIRSNIQNLRMRTAQSTSADMTVLYLGSSVNTSNLWGWAEEGYACDLQRAVAEGLSVNTVNIGKSSGYNVDLPSLIQRGWILAHEIGHMLDGKHIKNDNLMDGNFSYGAALSDFMATCAAKSYFLNSCAFNTRTWKFTDYYSCD